MKHERNRVQGGGQRSSSPLPAQRAFAVRFRPSRDSEPSSFEGRIEHVRSGRVAAFGTQDELVQRLAELLADCDAGHDPNYPIT